MTHPDPRPDPALVILRHPPRVSWRLWVGVAWGLVLSVPLWWGLVWLGLRVGVVLVKWAWR
jgi:hypothetical protein